MSSQKLHVARGDVELGLLTEAEIRELVRVGFLLPADECWADLDEERRSLASFGIEAPDQMGRWLDWVRVKAVTVGGTVREQAGGIASKAASFVKMPGRALPDAAGRLLDDFSPRLRALTQLRLKEKVIGPTSQALRDEEFLRKLFGAIYDCLPKPIHRFVTDEAFIAYCLRNRRRFLD